MCPIFFSFSSEGMTAWQICGIQIKLTGKDTFKVSVAIYCKMGMTGCFFSCSPAGVASDLSVEEEKRREREIGRRRN